LIRLANETKSERNMETRQKNGSSWKRMKERAQNKKEHLIKHRRHEANRLVQITKNWRFDINTHALYSRRS